jgi:hypothetical protein
MKRIHVAFIIAAVAVAQPKTASRTGYAIAPLVLKDEGCARDYLRAIAAGGVATRKQLAELVAFGCAEKMTGVFRGTTLEKKIPREAPTAIHRVSMVCAAYCGDKLVLTGWIVGREFQPATDAEIQAVIKSLSEK